MKLSIIIPVYKVEKYLEKCLNSCINQNVAKEDYEIIAIDDGSPDSCYSILERYKKNYCNLTIIRQKNQGLSMARNNGLEKASGEYVWFVDSDDYITENCLRDIFNYLILYNPDLMHLNYQIVNENQTIITKVENPQNKYNRFFSGKENLISKTFPIPAQMAIYKKAFLLNNNLRFFPNILHEDLEFKPRAIYLSNKVVYYQPIVYNFLKNRNGSITSKFTMKNAIGYINVMYNLHKFKEHYVKEKNCIKIINEMVGLALNNILDGLRMLTSQEQEIIFKQLSTFKIYYKDMINTYNIKYIFEGVLLTFNTSLSLKFYKLLK